MTRNFPDLAARAREIALEITSWPSVTGTPGEAEFSPRLANYLTSRGHRDVFLKPIPGDQLGRHNVFVLKRGKTNRSIVLSGHFDTVPYTDYGDLEELALSALALRDGLIQRLETSGEHGLALADFRSGDFLPGRGLLDMKSGVAAGLAALEFYDGEHTLLLVTTPDEEDRSAGMRAAAPQLTRLAHELGLAVELVINLDAISDQGDGARGRVVAMGSIGKQLLTAFVVGKESHACYPRDGANAAYIAAELVAEFELADELSEMTGDEIAAPPTALYAKDLKSGYNVTTPAQSFIYWNTLQHRRSGADVLDIAMRLACKALGRAEAKIRQPIRLMTYANLKTSIPDGATTALAAGLATSLVNLPERSMLITQLAWASSGLSGPAVVLGFGSIPYPAVTLQDTALMQVISDAAARHGLQSVNYFPGISDMSFVGEVHGDFESFADNTPIWGTSFTLSNPAAYPCINIGPWGRDYHHWLERLHAPYAFETLPKVLLEVIDAVFERG